ncbi:MAG: hypothetical protein JJU23_04200 [Cyclobacteriaceae bacterium]|nr:hypothetical protein [Cyclobacteriaceae bacterium]
MHKPESASQDDMYDLLKLVEAYPYFQGAHIVLAKVFHEKGQKDAQKKLHLAALHTANRAELKSIMKDGFVPYNKQEVLSADLEVESTTNFFESLNASKPDYKEEQINTHTVDTPEAKEPSEAVNQDQIIKNDIEEIPSGDYSLRNEKPGKIQWNETEGFDSKESKDSFFQELQENMAKAKAEREKLMAAFEKEEEKEKPKKKAAVKKKASPKVKKEVVKKESQPKRKVTKKKTTNTKKTQPAEDELIQSLKRISPQQELSKKIHKQMELIDAFINSDPTIARPKDKSDFDDEIAQELEDLSKKYEEITDDLISENLAEVLANQGKVEKSIEIYKRLSLKFPKKKTYFAKQIKKLKEDN